MKLMDDIDYQNSNDGGQFAREYMAKYLLENIEPTINPRLKNALMRPDYYTNFEGAKNYLQNEVNDPIRYYGSIGRDKSYVGQETKGYPYKDLASRLDAERKNATASTMIQYMRDMEEYPDPLVDPNGNPYGLINSYVNNLYDKLMNRR